MDKTDDKSSNSVVYEGNESSHGGIYEPDVEIPRLVARNLPYHQSKNKVRVVHKTAYRFWSLLRHDWFHILLRLSKLQSLSLLLTVWTGMIIMFASIYILIDNVNDDPRCSMGVDQETPIVFGAAFALALETCTTVGYGLPSGSNAYFEECRAIQFVIYVQMVFSMLFNAFLFAFLYSRMSTGTHRGVQVIASDKAVVSLVHEGGTSQVRFQVRLYDMDPQYPVIESHVRFYVIMKSHPVPQQLRLIQPNDELGGSLFLSMPTVASHHIDLYSLLHPPCKKPVATAGLTLRQVDSKTCGREEYICPICGESYGTRERWLLHAKYARMVEAKDNYPVEGTHLSLPEAELSQDYKSPRDPITDVRKLQEYFAKEVSEIICIVEGIDPIMSGTFSALHSYRYEDIVWDANAEFLPCMRIGRNKNEKNKSVCVDLDRFHQVIRVPSPQEGPVKCLEVAEEGRMKHSLRPHDSFCC